jgi:hypothetical protein
LAPFSPLENTNVAEEKKINLSSFKLGKCFLLVCQFESDRQVFHDGGTSTFTTVAPPKKQEI